jgi:hypothetical protein
MADPDTTTAIIKKFEPLIEKLTGHELTVLNKMVVDRIRLINKADTLISFSKLNVGDHVSWNGSDGVVRKGIVIKLNHKTASVKVDEQSYWNVSPQLLRKNH